MSCDISKCSRSLDTVCKVVVKLHDGSHSCIMEAEHVMNEVGSTCNVVVEVSRGQSHELVILSPKSAINSSLQIMQNDDSL